MVVAKGSGSQGKCSKPTADSIGSVVRAQIGGFWDTSAFRGRTNYPFSLLTWMGQCFDGGLDLGQ